MYHGVIAKASSNPWKFGKRYIYLRSWSITRVDEKIVEKAGLCTYLLSLVVYFHCY